MALGVKYFFKNQPKSQTQVFVTSSDIENSVGSLPDQISYNFNVKPILSDKCYTCHGPDPKSVQGNLRLDISDNWYRLSEEDTNKQIIFPGNINKSELVDRIRSTRASHQMPPPESNLEDRKSVV